MNRLIYEEAFLIFAIVFFFHLHGRRFVHARSEMSIDDASGVEEEPIVALSNIDAENMDVSTYNEKSDFISETVNSGAENWNVSVGTQYSDSRVVSDKSNFASESENLDSIILSDNPELTTLLNNSDSDTLSDNTISANLSENLNFVILSENSDSDMLTESSNFAISSNNSDSGVLSAIFDFDSFTDNTNSTNISENFDFDIPSEKNDSTSTILSENSNSATASENEDSLIRSENSDSVISSNNSNSKINTEVLESPIKIKALETPINAKLTNSSIDTEKTINFDDRRKLNSFTEEESISSSTKESNINFFDKYDEQKERSKHKEKKEETKLKKKKEKSEFKEEKKRSKFSMKDKRSIFQGEEQSRNFEAMSKQYSALVLTSKSNIANKRHKKNAIETATFAIPNVLLKHGIQCLESPVTQNLVLNQKTFLIPPRHGGPCIWKFKTDVVGALLTLRCEYISLLGPRNGTDDDCITKEEILVTDTGDLQKRFCGQHQNLRYTTANGEMEITMTAPSFPDAPESYHLDDCTVSVHAFDPTTSTKSN